MIAKSDAGEACSQIEDRRTEVDEADVLVYAPRFDGVMMKQERHTQQLIVEAPCVIAHPVLAEGLAMIRRYDEQGSFGEIVFLEKRDQPRELHVDQGNFAQIPFVRSAVFARTVVRRMWLEDVRVEERRPVAHLS